MIKHRFFWLLTFTCFIIVAYIVSVRFIIPNFITTTPTPDTTQTSPTAQVSTPLPSIHASDSQALLLYEKGLKIYYEQNNSPEALDLFNQALAIDPLCYEALNSKGATLAFQGKYDQGLAFIQQALDINPTYVYGHFNQGLANELASRWDTAIAAYKKALELDAKDTWSYYGIASIYGRQGKVDLVLDYLKQAIDLDPVVKEVAREEKDFALVRDDPRFQALVKP